MNISKNTVVSIDYVMKDAAGEILDSSEDNGTLDYIHGSGNLLPGLENQLEGRSVGDKISVEIAAKDAYGEYDKELVVDIPRSQFDTDMEIEEGMQFEAESAEGSRLVRVIEVKNDSVTVDANHPLAGETLFFEVEIKSIRSATNDEIENGLYDGLGSGCGSSHSHGCGGGCCGGGCCG